MPQAILVIAEKHLHRAEVKMAEYSFGRNILQYIQNQDELNLRAKQLATEEERYKAQQSFNQRQAQLTQARWQADYELKVAKEIADQENAFNKENTILNALPEDVRSQIPTEAYKYKGESIYVPNEVVTNLEQGNDRTFKMQKESFDQQKAIEDLKLTQQSRNLEAGRLQETIRHNLVMESKQDANSIEAKNQKIYKDSISSASDYLTKLKVFHSSDLDNSKLSDKDYATYKGNGIKAADDALSAVGILPSTTVQIQVGDKQGEIPLMDFIRQGANLTEADKMKFRVLENQAQQDSEYAKSTEWAQAKRTFYDKAIYSLDEFLTYDQLEALKLRNEIATR